MPSRETQALYANDPKTARRLGIKKHTVQNDELRSKKTYSSGTGSVMRPTINKPKTNHGKSKFFSEGGSTVKAKTNLKSLFKGKDTKSEELKEAKAIKSGKLTPMQYAKGEKMEDAMKAKKMAKGGGVESKGATKGRMVKMACGGKTKGTMR